MTDYEIVSSRLLYYPGRGFEVTTPIAGWYEKYQLGSPLKISDAELFSDPALTTYAAYVERGRKRESDIENALALADSSHADRELSPSWIKSLERLLAPLCYPCHGLQMAAAYLGSMAPAGRITLAALFQCGDEMRRIQALSRRLAQLKKKFPGFGDGAKRDWQTDPLWQPLRRTLENLLVAYDWGEAFVALNLAFKPAFDKTFMATWRQAALRHGDVILAEILASLVLDTGWHAQWSRALYEFATSSNPANRDVISRWQEKWRSEVDAALIGFAAEV